MTALKKAQFDYKRKLHQYSSGCAFLSMGGKSKHHCGYCGIKVRSHHLQHVYNHINKPLFKCNICETGSNQKEFIEAHLKQEHNGEGGEIYDNRWRHLSVIKEVIKACFRELYKDPVHTPTIGVNNKI
uniref:C2H2-type domain-containing protein n=1 Tax=Meloidogyne enterolobii TaxID=390850 RepID=A0A6V7XJ71_MELEN|nr:unnamed protein product [Meloidogyne enterolobii]